MNASFRLATLAAAALILIDPAAAQSARSPASREAELLQRVERLAAELDGVKAQLAEMKRQQADTAAQAAQASQAAAQQNASPSEASGQPATVLTSYGEINWNHYTRDGQNANDTATMRRFVLGFQHRFDARTKVVTELEIENAVSSADDAGEVEVEQAYIERQLDATWGLKAGLFLIPSGLLNENHEPTAYYGVERNFVETAIIPSTWREGGVQVFGNLDNGLTVQAGLSTGFNLGKWDASSGEGTESPLGAVHQELALAKSRDLSVFGALNWRGVPGLLLGGSVFTGDASHGGAHPTGAAMPTMRVTLWDLHARWTPGAWDLSGVYARGGISNTAAFNSLLVGSDVLVPRRFEGWYLQAAYKLWSSGDYALAPFARYERFNTGAAYADLGEGLTPAKRPTERVWTIGANFTVSPGVVVKADLQRFGENRDSNRLDLGLGWSF